MNRRFDLAVVGSGFAGSLISMIARRRGLSVVLLERGKHPRMVIGESSTPLANLLLETIADGYDLPRLRPLSKWGTWQEEYPQLGCGLKRGFTFFNHLVDGAATDLREPSERQMLVAASPRDRIADTHWYRADVDAWLVREAREMGAEYLDELALDGAAQVGGDWVLRGERHGSPLELRAGFVVDASGSGGFLSRALHLGTAPAPDIPATTALYAHFRDVGRYSPDDAHRSAGYAADDAALHHVFDGGWIWVLRFNNGVTSAGVAATRGIAEAFDLASGEAGWQRLLAALPDVGRQFAQARECTRFTWAPQIAFRSAGIAGENWALLPSSAGFVDPLLSTGFPLTLLGILRLAPLLESGRAPSSRHAELERYAEVTDAELVATGQLIAALYRTMSDFPLFRAVTLLYFAAASYAEAVRRLGRSERVHSFLLQDDPRFWPMAKQVLARARAGLSADQRNRVIEEIYEIVEEIDVAGLAARPADHCYPARAEDLYHAREKLGASGEEITAMLARSGFFAPSTEEPHGTPQARPQTHLASEGFEAWLKTMGARAMMPLPSSTVMD